MGFRGHLVRSSLENHPSAWQDGALDPDRLLRLWQSRRRLVPADPAPQCGRGHSRRVALPRGDRARPGAPAPGSESCSAACTPRCAADSARQGLFATLFSVSLREGLSRGPDPIQGHCFWADLSLHPHPGQGCGCQARCGGGRQWAQTPPPPPRLRRVGSGGRDCSSLGAWKVGFPLHPRGSILRCRKAWLTEEGSRGVLGEGCRRWGNWGTCNCAAEPGPQGVGLCLGCPPQPAQDPLEGPGPRAPSYIAHLCSDPRPGDGCHGSQTVPRHSPASL